MPAILNLYHAILTIFYYSPYQWLGYDCFFCATLCPFNNFESFHNRLRAQLAQDIDTLFAYAQLPSPLAEACRYVMTGQGKLVRPLLVASAFVSIKAASVSATNNSL